MNNSIKLLKVLTGISKGLNIANNVIPIYKDTKPLIKSFQKFCNNIKINNIPQNNLNPPPTITNNFNDIDNNTKKIITNNSNNPIFFI